MVEKRNANNSLQVTIPRREVFDGVTKYAVTICKVYDQSKSI